MWAIEDLPSPKAAYRGGGIILNPAILLVGSHVRGRRWAETVICRQTCNLDRRLIRTNDVYSECDMIEHWLFSSILRSDTAA